MEIRILRKQGKSLRAIAKEVGAAVNTVRKYLADDHAPRDITVELVGRQHRRVQIAHEQPGQESHGERLDQPIDEQRDADPPHLLANLVQGAEIDLHQHRDDHDPDEEAHRNIDPRQLHPAKRLKQARRELTGQDAGNGDQTEPRVAVRVRLANL